MKMTIENMYDLCQKYFDFDNNCADSYEASGYKCGMFDTIEYLYGKDVLATLRQALRDFNNNEDVNNGK